MDTAQPAPHDAARSRRSWVYLPLGIFAAMAALFAFALTSGDPSKLPSALIGRPAPAATFAPLEGLTGAADPVPGFTETDLATGSVTVVNFWASWCAPCVQEHPLLTELAKTGVRMFGVNYKDKPEAARSFLGRYGNPFMALGTDPSGRGAIEWGVYGMPETFVVNGRGEITYKHVGPMSSDSIATKILPAIEAARAAARTAPRQADSKS